MAGVAPRGRCTEKKAYLILKEIKQANLPLKIKFISDINFIVNMNLLD